MPIKSPILYEPEYALHQSEFLKFTPEERQEAKSSIDFRIILFSLLEKRFAKLKQKRQQTSFDKKIIIEPGIRWVKKRIYSFVWDDGFDESDQTINENGKTSFWWFDIPNRSIYDRLEDPDIVDEINKGEWN